MKLCDTPLADVPFLWFDYLVFVDTWHSIHSFTAKILGHFSHQIIHVLPKANLRKKKISCKFRRNAFTWQSAENCKHTRVSTKQYFYIFYRSFVQSWSDLQNINIRKNTESYTNFWFTHSKSWQPFYMIVQWCKIFYQKWSLPNILLWYYKMQKLTLFMCHLQNDA